MQTGQTHTNVLRSPTLAAVTPAITPDARLETEFMLPAKPAMEVGPAGAPIDIPEVMLMPPPAVTLIPAAAAAAAMLAEVKVLATCEQRKADQCILHVYTIAVSLTDSRPDPEYLWGLCPQIQHIHCLCYTSL